MALAWQASLFGSDEPGIDESFTGMRRIELDDTAWVDLLPGWLRGPDEVMELLVRTAPWTTSTRPMYDRIVAVPRLTAWYAWDGEHQSDAPPIVETMRAALSWRYDVQFTSCGCNLYRDGHDSVAWHGDRIRKEVADPRVAIVSVGEPRKLLLRPVGGGPSRRFALGHGDLFVMGGSSQRTWQHSVPKVASAAPRMSITFRHGMRDQPARPDRGRGPLQREDQGRAPAFWAGI
ncbi:MAG TPA: alpha-ketoglutarate-dependent dioxygenase AlkB [Acidimicrobiales bacterium]|nr:alpha-ketoglutarate-dependent dioxygenase AlkB [Acidimicrobiales bacterium]